MVSDKMTKEMFELLRSSVDTTWSTMTLMQNQAERMARLMIDQLGTAQAEGRQQMEVWVVEAKKKQEEFKKICDEGMKHFSDVVAPKE
jgi:hypothetical protein